MSKKITADNGAEIKVGQLGITIDHPEGIASIWARLTGEQRTDLADALAAPPAGGQWTRGDLWSVTRRSLSEAHPTRKLDTAELDALASYVADGVAGHALSRAGRAERERDEALRKKGEAFDRVVRAERERDAAVARAEIAAQLIPMYAMLDIWVALGRDSIHFDDWYEDQGYADAWAELTAAVRDGRGDLDAARENAEHYQAMFDATERQRDEWKARAEALEAEAEEAFEQGATWQKARTAQAVTRADIKKAIRDTLPMSDPDGMWAATAEAQTREVCALFGIEAEQAEDPEPDPVEVAIRDGLIVWGTTDRAVEEIAESVRRILGQEADQ